MNIQILCCACDYYTTMLSLAILISVAAGLFVMWVVTEYRAWKERCQERKEIAEMKRQNELKIQWMRERIQKLQAA